LEGAGPSELMQEAVSCAASLLDVEVAAVLELVREDDCFALRTGVGWPESTIGTLVSSTSEASQAAYAIHSRAPVVVADWGTETRFAQSRMLHEIGTRSGASVAIEGPEGPFGVLGVQSMTARQYSAGDVDFLQALANVLRDGL